MNNKETLQIRINQLEKEMQALKALKFNSSEIPYELILIKHLGKNNIEILSDEIMTERQLITLFASGLSGLINLASKKDVKNKDRIIKQVNNILKNSELITVNFINLITL